MPCAPGFTPPKTPKCPLIAGLQIVSGKNKYDHGIVWVEEDVDSMEAGSRGFPKDLAKQTILYKARKNNLAGSTFRLLRNK